MSKIYTLYHNNCPDGFGSALAAYLKFGDKSEYIGVKHLPSKTFTSGRGFTNDLKTK
jgi:hypothetical protein